MSKGLGIGVICPVCGKYQFEEFFSYDYCPVCGWQDDPVQMKFPDMGGANSLSLNEYREEYRKKLEGEA